MDEEKSLQVTAITPQKLKGGIRDGVPQSKY